MKIQISKKTILKPIIFALSAILIFMLGFYFSSYYYANFNSSTMLNPFVSSGELTSKPLLTYAIKNLQSRKYNTSPIILEEILTEENSYTTFLFSYTTLDKKMSGQINIPDSITANPKQSNSVIVLLRGYVPNEIYTTGMGTKNAAAVFANAGYITIAPDFFGYGESDPEPEDSWQTRFEKPIAVIELIKSLEKNGIPLNIETKKVTTALDLDNINIKNIGIWAHSNGGQIALTTLEILKKPIPTTLWAPVTAPFPYSITYFSDELADEGKAQRKWISMFEKDYDVFDFSLTQHLDSLTGPIQIQHGDADDAALIYWSEEFVDKVELENNRRDSDLEEVSLPSIDINLITHPNANHNLVPSWDSAIKKDVLFFNKWL
jgi:hypothetical protein